MKKMTKLSVAVVCVVVVVAGLVVVGYVLGRNNSIRESAESVKKERGDGRLSQFYYSSGGGMNGAHHCTTVSVYDDTRAIITIESREWHNEKMKVEELLVDIKILDELEAVFNKYGMKEWHQKTFTDMFEDDGESFSYFFEFDNFDFVSFSSQIYPEEYRTKLEELENIVKKYEETGEKASGLFKRRQ